MLKELSILKHTAIVSLSRPITHQVPANFHAPFGDPGGIRAVRHESCQSGQRILLTAPLREHRSCDEELDEGRHYRKHELE